MTKEELWKLVDEKSISGLYEVSNLGNLRNVSTKKIIKPTTTNSGYLQYNLTGKHVHFYAHRLVAKSFLGEFGQGRIEINHIDGNKKNNRVENLELSNSSLNKLHSFRKLGTKVHNISLTKEKAINIRKEYAVGDTSQKKIGIKYGVSTMVINRIINNIQNEYK
jgi:hypothetical protein